MQLNRQLLRSGNLSKAVSCGVTAELPERVVQFGEGNFLRAFADWMIDTMNGKGLFNGHVVLVQPMKQGLVDVLNGQDGVYTLLLRGMRGGESVETRQIITASHRGLDAYRDWAALVELMRSPEIRFVISNTTEAGIAYAEEPFTPDTCPVSFPAKIAVLLFARFQKFQGDPKKGLVFLPCELIERNGAKLKECVLKHADAWKLGGEFKKWVEESNDFLNTLVDRIVPGYPRAEAAKLTEELGYEDRLLVTAELFHLWVIEGPARLADEIPFHKAGLDVIWTDDMTPYRSRKVRVLNGAHTCSVLGAYLSGLNTVGEMMKDEVFGRFVEQAVFQEIVPALKMEETARRTYAEAVLERFCNPYIRHELLSISLNSVSKWKVRVLPSLLDYLDANQKLPSALTFSLAALIRFYRGTAISETEFRGVRNNEPYPINDDRAILEFFERSWAKFSNDYRALAGAVLANHAFWGIDLTGICGLTDAVAAHLQAIDTLGAHGAAASILPQ